MANHADLTGESRWTPPAQRAHAPSAETVVTSEETAVSALLTQHPDAFVNAINDRGLFVPLPATVPINGHRQLAGRSALDVVTASDRGAIISAWERTRQQGGAHVSATLVADPPVTGQMHFVDVQEVHGVVLGVFVPQGIGDDTNGAAVNTVVQRPRFCRIRKNEVAVFLDLDEAAELMLGFSPDDLIGKRSLDFIHPDDHDVAIASWMEMLSTSGLGRRCRLRHLRGDGTYMWVEITNNNRLAEPGHDDVLADLLDITDEMATHEALRESEQLLRRLAESLPMGVFQIDTDCRVVYTNERLHDIVGVDRTEMLDQQFATVESEDMNRLQDAVRNVLRGRRDQDFEVQLRHPSLEPAARRCTISLRSLTSESGLATGAVGSVNDITESARLRKQLEDRATYDHLTGCLNRASIISSLDRSRQNTASGSGSAVIFIDIDRFKRVNDELGHAAGDELLMAVASRLRNCVREDSVGRLGGDEFLVICDSVPGRDRAASIGARIAQALHGQVRVGGLSVPLRASIGVAWSDDPAVSADALLARADAAMYVSKRNDQGEPVLSQD
jgi:diguanylate cyclase (GGDEF)-like protein/PAS domain S-box-containing protein